MARSNALVATTLRRYAATLAIERADRFKIKAYRRAADTIDRLDRDVSQMISDGEPLTTLPGIGKAISGVIEEILQTGHLGLLDPRLKVLPPELLELSTHPGLDPHRVLRVYQKFGLKSLAELQAALNSGQLGNLDRRTEFHIRQGLSGRRRLLLWDADKIAPAILAFLESLPAVTQVAAVGSLRRRTETVGDLNFLVQTSRASTVFRQFEQFGGLKRVKSTSRGKAQYEFSTGLGISLTAAKSTNWGTALIATTGSVNHVRQLEKVARAHRQASAKSRPAEKNEQRVYANLGLKFVPPELREGRGEIEVAADDRLPRLIEISDLRGDLHMHTTASDGADSLAEMAKAARNKGYEYIAITDHSHSLKIANGLTERQLLSQIKAIDRFNERQSDFTVLKSAEVDILEDGSLDYSDATLRRLDFTICSIHSRFALNKRQQTDRILRAMDNRYFTILGHATGRLLLKREGYELDMEKVLRRAEANGCFVEINSSPDRLDLSDEHARRAKERGIKVAVNTDAHSIRELQFITAGINQARRAWLEPSDVLNTLELSALRNCLRQRR